MHGPHHYRHRAVLSLHRLGHHDSGAAP